MTDFFPSAAEVEQVEARVSALVLANVPAADLASHLTDVEHEILAKEGLKILIQRSIGEKIAQKVWDSGIGMDATHEEVRGFWRSLNIPDEDGDECYQAFMEHMADATAETVNDYESLAKFAPLFEGEPEGLNLGELAERKAAHGDKLAMSFLAWKEIA
ncbi:hypothetical protein [Agrobacterium radiobacter]|uniref:hypothetical protein n=1 Tax=Agrobacterium radiobacter TaxID=362 RepID=UPI003CF74C28